MENTTWRPPSLMESWREGIKKERRFKGGEGWGITRERKKGSSE